MYNNQPFFQSTTPSSRAHLAGIFGEAQPPHYIHSISRIHHNGLTLHYTITYWISGLGLGKIPPTTEPSTITGKLHPPPTPHRKI
nr:hypothetical protein Q903MT_gene2452 [Picea sitchensis]